MQLRTRYLALVAVPLVLAALPARAQTSGFVLAEGPGNLVDALTHNGYSSLNLYQTLVAIQQNTAPSVAGVITPLFLNTLAACPVNSTIFTVPLSSYAGSGVVVFSDCIAAALGFRMPSDHPPLANCHAACRATTHCRESAYRQLHFWDRNLFSFHCWLLAQTTTFAETFNNGPNYPNNWTIAWHHGLIPLDNTAALRLVLASSLFDPIPSDLNVRYGGFAL